MKLLGKVNLLLVLIFGCSWGITEIYAYRFLMLNARDEVIRQAELMMQGATSNRNYTAEHIKPLLESELGRSIHFHPETVPAFGKPCLSVCGKGTIAITPTGKHR